MDRAKKLIPIVVSAFFFMGCNSLNLTVNFKEIQGLTQGAPVILDHTPIGRVKKILPRKNDIYPTALEIDSDFKALLTENSTFSLVPEYLDKEQKAPPRTVIMVAKSAPGGTPLKNNSVVEGSPHSVVPELSNLLEKFTTGFDSLKDQINKIPESTEYKAFEQSIDEITQQMKDSGKEVRERIKNDILPKLEQEFKAFKKRLMDQGAKDPDSQQELYPLEKKLNNLKEI